jgi:phenylalanine-4-hydroxylase
MENNEKKVYGAGILSSLGEFEYALSDKPKFYELNCKEVGEKH